MTSKQLLRKRAAAAGEVRRLEQELAEGPKQIAAWLQAIDRTNERLLHLPARIAAAAKLVEYYSKSATTEETRETVTRKIRKTRVRLADLSRRAKKEQG